MAGLIELDSAGRLFNCYVTVGPEGFITRFRKLHTFISPYLSPGDSYNVIDLLGIKAGFLICYDNNLPENVRITAHPGGRGDFHAARDGLSSLDDAGSRDGRAGIVGRTATATRSGCASSLRARRGAAG